MKVESIMKTDLISLSMDSSLSEAKEVFENNNVHHLIVTDDEGLLAGVLTDRDLYKHLSPTVGTSNETHRDTALMHKKLHQIMARELITINASQSLSEAAALIYDNHVSCLPVIDEQNKPIAIMTWRDLLRVLSLKHKKSLTNKI